VPRTLARARGLAGARRRIPPLPFPTTALAGFESTSGRSRVPRTLARARGLAGARRRIPPLPFPTTALAGFESTSGRSRVPRTLARARGLAGARRRIPAGEPTSYDTLAITHAHSTGETGVKSYGRFQSDQKDLSSSRVRSPRPKYDENTSLKTLTGLTEGGTTGASWPGRW
jgi:hypothetical protein